MCVESVLISVDTTPVYDGLVCSDPKRHRLVLFRPGGVSEADVLGYKSISHGSCVIKSNTRLENCTYCYVVSFLVLFQLIEPLTDFF